ncbi:hypothetical protein [Acaryochloris thomasi]|uniref:hypothetical protein n=1 Tax=Acaryochloris thomasi TaxID=2929456 RepID=UPI0011B3F8DC|nr:hypothetical protein [Acaryochloris thomasi]
MSWCGVRKILAFAQYGAHLSTNLQSSRRLKVRLMFDWYSQTVVAMILTQRKAASSTKRIT